MEQLKLCLFKRISKTKQVFSQWFCFTTYVDGVPQHTVREGKSVSSLMAAQTCCKKKSDSIHQQINLDLKQTPNLDVFLSHPYIFYIKSKIMPAFNAVLSESPKIMGIQKRFSVLFYAYQDLSRYPDSLSLLMMLCTVDEIFRFFRFSESSQCDAEERFTISTVFFFFAPCETLPIFNLS